MYSREINSEGIFTDLVFNSTWNDVVEWHIPHEIEQLQHLSRLEVYGKFYSIAKDLLIVP